MEVRVKSYRADGSCQVSLRYSKYSLKTLMERTRNNPGFIRTEVYNLEGHSGDGQLIHREYHNGCQQH